jgi:1-acyl-sn-glycerol-3-phosphate acyltransferase
MLKILPPPVRGVLSLTLYILNTVFWAIPILAFAILKLIIPIRGWRVLCGKIRDGSANNWVAVNILIQRLFCRIKWDVEGLENLDLKGWYLVVANHQSWVDIVVLQKVFYRKIPFLKFFLKKELFWVPVLGLCWWALDFPFMKRYTPAFLKKHPHLKGKDLEITRQACKKFRTLPVSIMNFVEGTRFTREKHNRQKSPYTNLLKTRAGGMAFVLSTMGEQLHRIIDVTIVYPRGAQNFWAFVCGEVREIKVCINSIPVTEELLGDYRGDRAYRVQFHAWLNNLWAEKDRRMDGMISG